MWQNTDFFARSDSMLTILGSTYGTNKATGNIVVKADAIPHYHADYYTAHEMSERLYKSKTNLRSSLVTGTQWDMMIQYMQDKGVVIEGEGCNWGNYVGTSINEITGYYIEVDSNGTTSNEGFKNGNGYTTNNTNKKYAILTTGASEKVKKMNLYDVAGNLWEWTEESGFVSDTYSTSEYNTGVIRGGHFGSSHKINSACNRYCEHTLETRTGLGFRVVLYLM